MEKKSMNEEYETIIGLEVHIELATKTKIFCGCSTAFGGSPNSHTCPVCTGMPGTLPILNKKMLEYSIAAGLACHCRIAPFIRFDRKNYFYPDNPQNYQISQLYSPLCQDGFLEIQWEEEGNLQSKKVGIHEIHMEEDAGKLIHEEEGNYSYVDYNRAGVPLIEIVSCPDMRSAKEVIAYLEVLKTKIQYLGISDCKLQEGSMRADVNLSVRKKGSNVLGTRTEMKNLASFRAITKAIETERKRQIALLEAGEPVIQETRRWDEKREESFSMRSKEDAKDYRYFPEPDLPPVRIMDSLVSQIKESQPEFQPEKKKRFLEQYGLSEYDADILTSSLALANLLEETVGNGATPKKASNWIMVETMYWLKEKNQQPEDILFSGKNLAELIGMIEKKQITQSTAKEIFAWMFETGGEPVSYAKEKGLWIVCDEGLLERVIEEVLQENPQAVSDFKGGKERALGALVGQTMKKMKGKADPQTVQNTLREKLS